MIRPGRVPVFTRMGQAVSETYLQKVQAIAPNNLLALWPLGEGAGTTAYDQSGNGCNGASIGLTFNQAGIGDGGSSPLFVPASSSRINVFSSKLASIFNGLEGTLVVWFKIRTASIWTDGAQRQFFIVAADSNNYIQISKAAGNNGVNFAYKAGGTLSILVPTYSALTWSFGAITWDKAGDKVIPYMNGIQQGATITGLGTWAGTLADGNCNISQAGQLMDGNLAYAALWSTPLNQTQITALATVP